MRWEYTGVFLLLLVFGGVFFLLDDAEITGQAVGSLANLATPEGVTILATEPTRVKISERGKVSWRQLPEHLTKSNLLNDDSLTGKLNVIVVLNDQPLSQISREENRIARPILTENSEQIKKIRRKAKLGIKEIQEVGAIRAEIILQSRLTEADKAQIEIVKRHIDATKDQVKKNIIAAQGVAVLESQRDAKAVIESCGGTVTGGSVIVNSLFAKIPAKCLDDLQASGGVLAVYEDKLMEVALDKSVCATGAATWYSGGYNGSTWDLAVADTGIDGSHPALTVSYANVFHNTASGDSSYADNASDPDDYHGHGTHIGGTIASQNATYKGIAHGMDALINAKFGFLTDTNGGSGYWSDAMDAIDWAINVTEGADVISFSFGGGTLSDDTSMARYFDALVDSLGIHAAVAAGNEGCYFGCRTSYTVGDPAIAYNIFSVANNDDKNTCTYTGDVTDDSIRDSSSKGPTIGERIKPDIGAPGTGIIASNDDWEGGGSDWVSMTGTSMATPHVAGSVLLVLDFYGYNRDPRAVKALLLNSANNSGVFSDQTDYGWGEIDLNKAYIQKDFVIEDNVTENGGYRLYKLNVTTGDKTTLVWNRHADYIGSSYPSTYYTLNDLDIELYKEDFNLLDDVSQSSVDNVEQVNASSSYDGVIKVIGWTTDFTHGLNYEEFALAAEDVLVPATGPSFLLYPQFTYVSDADLPHTVSVTVTNNGDLAVHNVTTTITVPLSVTISSGSTQELLTIAAGSNATAYWNLTTTTVDTNHTGIFVNVTAQAYGENLSADTTDQWFYVYDDDTTAPAFSDISFPPAINISDGVDISVNITDASGVSSATIYYDYSNDGSLDGTMSMTLLSELWNGTIPAPGETHAGNNISFYVNTTDGDNDRAGDAEVIVSATYETHVIDSDVDDDGFSDTIYGGTDCDDTNSSINPNATEIEYNGIDDDCNVSTTDDDIDSDGYNSTVTGGTDCNDYNSSIAPNATEITYNGYDDDCNILTRDDDLDTDGYNSTVTGGTDCNDTSSSINPGQTEIVYNGVDDDCTPTTRDDDLDQDGYNNSDECDDNNASINPGQTEIPYNGADDDCAPVTPDDDIDNDAYTSVVTGGQDCDDNNASISPDQTEITYNGADDDCNATTPDDDIDSDGYNSTATGGQDCNDNNASISPNSTEIPYNGIDDDCAPASLDDDLDSDGYNSTLTGGTDCNDTNSTINPGQLEIPYNGVDDDCAPSTPDDDIDEDGFNSIVTGGLDCNDNNPGISPNATEIIDDIDQDCVNDAPSLNNISDQIFDELDMVQVLASATDFDDNSSLAYYFSSPLTSNGLWNTTLDDAGNYTVTVTVNDGEMNDSIQFTLIILDLFDSDDDGIPDRNDTDDDNDGILDGNDNLTGDETFINTTLNISMTIDNSSNLNQTFNGTRNISIKEGNNTLTEFNFNFSEMILNLANMTIDKNAPGASKGAVLIKGLDLGNGTKSVYIPKLSSGSNGVCIKDAQVLSLSEVSSSCNGGGEIILSCPGTSGRYTCTELTGRYKVSGLRHSAIVEYVPSSSSGGGGGGGGGGSSTSSEETLIVPSSAGFEVTARKGQTLNIVLKSTTFALRIQSITTDAVVFLDTRTAKTPFVAESFTLKYDLDGDGQQDIEIVLVDAAVNKATMIIKTYTPPQRSTFTIPATTPTTDPVQELVEEQEPIQEEVHVESVVEAPEKEQPTRDMSRIIGFGVGGIIILGALLALVLHFIPRHKVSIDKPSSRIENDLELMEETNQAPVIEQDKTSILKEEEKLSDLDEQIHALDEKIDDVSGKE